LHIIVIVPFFQTQYIPLIKSEKYFKLHANIAEKFQSSIIHFISVQNVLRNMRSHVLR